MGSTAAVTAAPARRLSDPAVAAAYETASRLMDSLLHDARNPLNALSINLEVLTEKLKGEDGEVPAAQEKNLRAMREQIFRVDAILKQYADFIAPRQSAATEVDLSELVKKTVEVLGHESRKRRVRLTAKIEPSLRIRCQELSSMHMLVLHAAMRGLSRAAASSEVEIAVARSGNRAVMTVRDSAGAVTEPSPEVLDALEILGQHNGVAVKVAQGECELSAPVL